MDAPRESARRIRPRFWRLAALGVFLALPAAGMVLSFQEAFFDGVGPVDGLAGANAVAVSADGRSIYVASKEDGAVGVFSRDASLDTIAFRSSVQDGQNGVFGIADASGVAASPDGRHVYVTGQGDASLVVFGRDATQDRLALRTFAQDGVGGVSGLAQPTAVAVSPDGRMVVATSASPGALAVFTRSATRDALGFVDSYVDDVGTVEGIDGASAVAISPDGVDIYVTGARDASLAHFVRDASRDQVAFVASYRNPQPGIRLRAASAVAVSPDSRHVYATSFLNDSVQLYRRLPGAPRLAFVAQYRHDRRGVRGIRRAAGVSVSPDGRFVAVVGFRSHALAVFARDAQSGRLRQVDRLVDGLAGVDGMRGPMAVTHSPDGQNVLVTSFLDDALAAFTDRVPISIIGGASQHGPSDEPSGPDGSDGAGGGDDAHGSRGDATSSKPVRNSPNR